MRNPTRRVLVPALTALALAASGCSAGGTDATARPATTTTIAVADAPAAAAPAAADRPRRLEVAAAPQATPSAVARPAADGASARRSTLTVASYDKRTRHAVIATGHRSPAPAPGPSAGTGHEAPLRVGDVIASPPAPGAPQGLLAEVTGIVRSSGDRAEVTTRPAPLSAVLADDTAEGKVAVDPSALAVEPLTAGVSFSWSKPGGVHVGPHGATVDAGRLRVDVGTSIATAEDAPLSAAASLDGFVELSPEVEFAYEGTSPTGAGKALPGTAFLGMSGDWSAQWALKGRAAAKGTQRIPFARLHADPVIQIGPVPVVVNLDLTLYLQVGADGRITLDVRQDVQGDFRVGGRYARGTGWTPVSDSKVTSTPVKATVTAAGRASTALGAEASVGLYGMVGLTADFAPYLRAEAEARADADTGGGASVTGSWALHGGFDLAGTLRLQLSVFGTPLFTKRIPLGSLHREWPLAEGHGRLTA
ncbi:hypothetical protein [Streptomyces sp. NPDC089919]|uniref:hypothetical protein n=1 Tax=Streptomyces sp. NPDC089919 TaxID=3155188 RepID=UPI00343413CE